MRRLAIVICAALLISLDASAPARAAGVEQTWAVNDGTSTPEPYGVTVDPRDGTVYVALSDHNNTGPGYMWAINPATTPYPYNPPTVPLPRFQLPSTQVMSVLDTGLDRLFVSLANGVGVVDAQTHALLATVPLAGGAIGLDLDPVTHHVFAGSNSGVAIIDGASGTVLATRAATATGDAWWRVAHDAVTHLVYVANGNYLGSPSLVVLADTDLSFVASIPMPEMPRLGLAIDTARGLVYTGGYCGQYSGCGTLYAVDETTRQIVKTLDIDTAAGVFSLTYVPEKDALYASMIYASSSPHNAVVAVDTSSFTVAQRIATPFEPGQSALHPDGRLYVSAFDTGALAAIRIADTAPVVDAVSLAPVSPYTNDVLVASATAHDPDGDPLTLRYEWSRNGAVLTDETSATLDLSRPGNGDRGDVITVRVTASDGTLSSPAVSATVTVANSAPTVSLALSPTAPRSNDTLVATATGADADHDALTYTYTWSVSKKVKQVVVTTSPTSSFTLRALQAQTGDTVTVSVVASDGTASSPTAASSVTVGKN